MFISKGNHSYHFQDETRCQYAALCGRPPTTVILNMPTHPNPLAVCQQCHDFYKGFSGDTPSTTF